MSRLSRAGGLFLATVLVAVVGLLMGVDVAHAAPELTNVTIYDPPAKAYVSSTPVAPASSVTTALRGSPPAHIAAASVTYGSLHQGRVAAKSGPGVGKALELSPWPANSGFMHEPVETVLKAGTRVDRFGADAGTFTAQVGTPLRQRAMRQGAENAPYSVFELQQDITVRGGITAPAFGQPGGGIQYQFPSSMASLLESGAIRRLP